VAIVMTVCVATAHRPRQRSSLAFLDRVHAKSSHERNQRADLFQPSTDSELNIEISSALESISSASKAPDVDISAVLEFERNGHTVTRNLFDGAEIAALDPHIRALFTRREFDAWLHSTRVMLGDEAVYDDFGELMLETSEECREALEEYDVLLPFLQVFNSWRVDAVVRAVASSPRLARTAATLLGVPRVRLYQDSMFLKRSGDGETRWHSDLHMAPFDTNHMVTAWIPLDHVPAQDEGGTGLTFASGSHRDFALPFWSRPHESGTDFSARYADVLNDHGSLRVGDATWHHGWTLHSAPPNDPWFGVPDDDEDALPTNTRPRLALTVSFIADGARLQARPLGEKPLQAGATKEGTVGNGAAEEVAAAAAATEEATSPAPQQVVVPIDDEDRSSYEEWVGDLAPGAVADHPLLPVVWGGSNDP